MRILLVSYHLYPDGTAEGLCVAKTARTLRDAGHEVTVVTSDRTGPEHDDSAGAMMLSGIRICRIRADASTTPGWAVPFYRLGRAAARSPWIPKQLAGRASAFPNLILGCNQEEYLWVAAAANRIVSLWNESQPRFDVIHSRLNHSVSHLAVLTGLLRLSPPAPWSAHFSDPWPHHLYPPPYRSKVGPLFRRRLEGMLSRILARAGSLTFPAERLMRFMLSGKRAIHRGKAHVVPHLGNFCWHQGAQPEDRKFNILFAGRLLTQRDPTVFLRGLRRFVDNHPAERHSLSVRFLGRPNPLFAGVTATYGLQDVVSMESQASFTETCKSIARSHVLLIIESVMEEGIFMPSKLADYISAGKPILALSPPVGTVADFLSDSGGIRVDPDKPDRVAEALHHLHLRWRTGRLDELKPSSSLLERISPASVVPAYEAAFRQAMETASSW